VGVPVDGRRFVVRELEGPPIKPGASRRAGVRAVGLTVWVADEAFYGREVRVWRSEEDQSKWFKRQRMRRAAQALADELEAAG
jgi:hypothetical protein